MCGRFTQKSERKTITKEFYVQQYLSDVVISYNVAPGQNAGVIIKNKQTNYIQFRWGLVPSWARDPAIGNKLINARAETITKKPSFKRPFYTQRCIIPVDGFFEWKKTGTDRLPYYVASKSQLPLALAGLWERWMADDKSPLYTFTIITTEANGLLQPIHNRMPVIIMQDMQELWLNSTHRVSTTELTSLLFPTSPHELTVYQVSRMVNSPKNNSSECIKPIE